MLNIETIEENLEKLLRIEAALKAKLARGYLTHPEYQQTLVRIDQERKKWEEKLPKSPATELWVNSLLCPLFKNYLWLRLAQNEAQRADIAREIRATVMVMDRIINRIRSTKI